MTEQEELLKQIIESSLNLEQDNTDCERRHYVFRAEYAITGDAIDFLVDLYDAEYYTVSPVKKGNGNIQLQVWLDEPKKELTVAGDES